MDRLRDVMQLVSDHPIVAVFLALCIGGLLSATADFLIKLVAAFRK